MRRSGVRSDWSPNVMDPRRGQLPALRRASHANGGCQDQVEGLAGVRHGGGISNRLGAVGMGGHGQAVAVRLVDSGAEFTGAELGRSSRVPGVSIPPRSAVRAAVVMTASASLSPAAPRGSGSGHDCPISHAVAVVFHRETALRWCPRPACCRLHQHRGMTGAWESRAKSAARSTICGATWLSWRVRGRHWGCCLGCTPTVPL